MSKRAWVTTAMACAALLCGCGATEVSVEDTGGDRGGTRAKTPQDPAPPLVMAGGEVMLSCGSGPPSFAASTMAGGVTGIAEEAEVAAALEDLAADAAIDAPRELQRAGIADAQWTVLGSDTYAGSEMLIVGVGGWDANGPSDDGEYVILDRVDDGWRAGSWGQCNLAPVLRPGVSWAEMATTADGLDAAETSLEVEVHERECTTGRDPAPFLNEPVVVEGEETVTVYWTSAAPQGASACLGNPSVSRVVELRRPLGDRVLLDGSAWPPKPVSGS